MPVKYLIRDRTETSIGGAQKDLARELAAKAASLQPVMWAGIAMMTLVAGALAYFGWWTKAALAVVVGLGMIVFAATLPDHGTLILLGGFGVFGLAALLVLYSMGDPVVSEARRFGNVYLDHEFFCCIGTLEPLN